MPTPSGCARRTSSPSWCSTSTSPARRPGSWPENASARSSNDPCARWFSFRSRQRRQAAHGQSGGGRQARVYDRAHRQGHDRVARSRPRRRVRERDAAHAGGERRGAGAEAADRAAVGQRVAQGGGEGHPGVRSRPHAVERRQSHPHSDSAADGRAPQRAGQSRAQVRRRRARGDPACAHRDDEPDQEDRARLLRRPEARREGSAEDARRSSQGGRRGGEGQRSGDHGSLMIPGPIPRHVAIIMDGNGRWANERRLPRPFGHRAGMKAVREAVEGAIDAGVAVLTLFAFSDENWNRPAPEISALMDLLEEYIAKEVAELKGQGVRVNVLGDLGGLTSAARSAVQRGYRDMGGGPELSLNLCISYSSRGENAGAARLLAEEVLKGTKQLEDIDEEAIRAKLYTAPWGDPDLLIRTSGEQRLSNFLLWQLAYTELYITPVLWPDFNRRTLRDAILDYQRRDRRFGKVTAS